LQGAPRGACQRISPCSFASLRTCERRSSCFWWSRCLLSAGSASLLLEAQHPPSSLFRMCAFMHTEFATWHTLSTWRPCSSLSPSPCELATANHITCVSLLLQNRAGALQLQQVPRVSLLTQPTLFHPLSYTRVSFVSFSYLSLSLSHSPALPSPALPRPAFLTFTRACSGVLTLRLRLTTCSTAT